jgi:hypothetical protein
LWQFNTPWTIHTGGSDHKNIEEDWGCVPGISKKSFHRVKYLTIKFLPLNKSEFDELFIEYADWRLQEIFWKEHNEWIWTIKDDERWGNCETWTDREEIVSYISDLTCKFFDDLSDSMKEIAKKKVNQWFGREKMPVGSIPFISSSLLSHNGKDFVSSEESINSPKFWSSYLKLLMIDLNEWIPLLETRRSADISHLSILKELASALSDFENKTITDILSTCFMFELGSQNLLYRLDTRERVEDDEYNLESKIEMNQGKISCEIDEKDQSQKDSSIEHSEELCGTLVGYLSKWCVSSELIRRSEIV